MSDSTSDFFEDLEDTLADAADDVEREVNDVVDDVRGGDAGTPSTTSREAQVTRLYDTVFDRPPDDPGLNSGPRRSAPTSPTSTTWPRCSSARRSSRIATATQQTPSSSPCSTGTP